jgi:hypothetical protein
VARAAGKDSVLLLDDVLAERDQGLLEPPGPERVARRAVRRLGEHLLDLAVLVDQAGHVVAEVLDHRREERALLDGRVRPEDGDDGARSVGATSRSPARRARRTCPDMVTTTSCSAVSSAIASRSWHPQ